MKTLQILKRLRSERLTYLNLPKLGVLVATCREALALNSEGIVIEAGCALGGSAILIAHLKEQRRELVVYDTFAGIPAPGPNDDVDAHGRFATIASGESKGLGDDDYYGYQENLLRTVEGNFARMGYPAQEHGVHLIPGDIRETMGREGPPVAFAHLDVDWHDATAHALDTIWSRLAQDGRILIDDYGHWNGCRNAVDEFVASRSGPVLADTGLGSAVICKH